ncbi:glutathione S-transferase 1-like [Wyeomyia smithii]|uniref:glutathione S-transferase 1-like n=1 Tax=Wyeomyia smithii TaxID=174621 RepID=UPI002467C38A|nr:glutathione S-transferase 1-like [Wyeomyia smithii]
MDLYYTIVSPPSRSVILLARYLDISLNLKDLKLATGEHLSEWFLKINPQHCVPTLVTEEGVPLWESNAIMVYLADRFDKEAKVYPKDPLKRAVVNQRLCFDLTTLYKNVSGYYGPIVMRGATPDENLYKQVEQAFGYLEGFLAKSKFAAGDQITVADFALITSVSMAAAMKFDLTKYPNVERWTKLCVSTMTGYEDVSNQAKAAWKAFMESKQSK